MEAFSRTQVVLEKDEAAALETKFPGLGQPNPASLHPVVVEPAIFMDRSGRILAWSLPDIILPQLQVRHQPRRALCMTFMMPTPLRLWP